ncbi:MAG: DNA helicase RecQ [Huintestinicola sp.]
MEHNRILKQYFGYESFRTGQEELVTSILAGRDCLGVMPTGAGKSVCFQVPALMFDGITIVISPLISLMSDQVSSLVQAGIRAAYINSSLTSAQMSKVISNAYSGMYKIIYIAPERLEAEGFINLALSVKISMITVDEAHCISHWGQDFRPSYLKIREFVDKLPYRPVISAFTATATQTVRDDIISILRLNDPFSIVTGFDRQNLYFGVESPSDKYAALKKHVTEYSESDRSGIIYCSTRKNVEAVCEKLCSDGISATRYHAGLTETERKQNQDEFICDSKKVMVATNAFGMGIDKSNVSYVIHYNMPKDIESYYQEAGRAGRDGSPADCIILYSGQDVVMNRFLIDRSFEESEFDEDTAKELRDRDYARLRSMTFYCTSSRCLRSFILEYFGEKAPPVCSNCSVCCSDSPETDITIEAQKILSCIIRSGQRYGISTIVKILRGKKDEKLIGQGLDKLTTYGIMKESSDPRIKIIIERLKGMGYIEATDGQYPILKVTAASGSILRGKETIRTRLPEEKQPKEKKKPVLPWADGAYAVDDRLLVRLRTLRASLAAKQKVPAYVIFSDASLRDMCMKLPKNDREFITVSGVGTAKLERYGYEFISEIRAYLEENPRSEGQEMQTSPPKHEEECTDPGAMLAARASKVDISEEEVPISVFVSSVLACTGVPIKTNILRNAMYQWLTKEGYLAEGVNTEGKPTKVTTPKSESIGIHTVLRMSTDGRPYKGIMYTPKAQRFLLAHMREIGRYLGASDT